PEEHRAGIIRIVNEGNATGGGRDLFQCLEQFAEYRQFQVCKAGDVAAGPREALHPADADRIAYPRNDDRDGARELHQYRDHPTAGGDDVRVRGHQACCVRPHARHIVGGPTLVELNIAAFGPSELCDLLPQRASTNFIFGIALSIRHDNPHAPHSACVLCPSRERPRGSRTAEQRDERPALHSITSSATASNLSGNWRPNAFAVLRLITSSNLVGCTTGKSAGFSPLRTRPT